MTSAADKCNLRTEQALKWDTANASPWPVVSEQPGRTEPPQRHEAVMSTAPRSGSWDVTPLPAAAGGPVCAAPRPAAAAGAELLHPSSPAPAAPAQPVAAPARSTPRPYDTALRAGPPHPGTDADRERSITGQLWHRVTMMWLQKQPIGLCLRFLVVWVPGCVGSGR